MYDEATAITADPNPPSTSNEREGTTSVLLQQQPDMVAVDDASNMSG